MEYLYASILLGILPRLFISFVSGSAKQSRLVLLLCEVDGYDKHVFAYV